MKEDLNKQSWEERLREAAGKVEVQPSGLVWNKVKEQLPASHGKIYFYRWAAAAALLILIGLGAYFWLLPGQQSHQSVRSLTSRDRLQEKAAPKIPKHRPSAQRSAHPQASRPVKQSIAANTSSLSPSGILEDSGKNAKSSKSISSPRILSQEHPKERPVISGLPHLSKIRWQDIAKEESRVAGTPSLQSLQYSERIIQLLLPSAELSAHPDAEAERPVGKSGENREGKLAVGLFFTPGMSYRTLKTPGKSHSPIMNAAPAPSGGGYSLMSPLSTETNRMNRSDKPMQQKESWGWESGLRVTLNLSKGWILQSGLSLRETNYKVTAYKGSPAYVNQSGNSMATARPMANSMYALYVSRLPENNLPVTLQNKYLNTELPLLIGRSFGNPDKLSFSILAGAGITYLLRADAVMYAPKSRRYFSDKDYLHPFNSSLILETNLDIPLSRNFHFSIGPVLQYQISSSYKDYKAVKEFPYLIGLKTAFHLK